MSIRLALLRDAIRSRLWVIPGIAGVAAFIAAEALVAIDRALGASVPDAIAFGGGAESARSVLSTIAAAMLSFTGLVFSVTMLVLQLASSQLSPRVTRTFLRDRFNQAVLGLFVATFVYALLVLREVRSPGAGPAFVPGIAIWWAFALLLASIAAFVAYIDHMARSIRASSVIDAVAAETRSAIERLYPAEVGSEPDARTARWFAARLARGGGPVSVVRAGGTSGVVLAVDDERLLERATGAGVVIELLARVGEHVVAGSPLLVVHHPAAVTTAAGGAGTTTESAAADEAGNESEAEADSDFDDLRTAVNLGSERTMEQDAAFGFRQLVDIADRALSPGMNDPTTAIQVLDELHDLLRRLVRRDFPAPTRLDESGELRLILPRPGWDDYLDLALDELRLHGAGALQVARRMSGILDDLATVAPPHRIAPIRRHRALIDAAIDRAYPAAHDREIARRPERRDPIA